MSEQFNTLTVEALNIRMSKFDIQSQIQYML
jgi:hypothetical protein